MKRQIFLFLVFCSILQVNGQFEIAGDTCSNNSIEYKYQNYSYGNHGYGFNIMRNGDLVYNEDVYYDFVRVDGMHFINDSVGFIMKRNSGIYKTETYANTWSFFSNIPPIGYNYKGLYFLNENVGYSACQYVDSMYIYKHTDHHTERLFAIKYDSVSVKRDFVDTIPIYDYPCGDLQHLFFNWYINNDTVQIDLNFVNDLSSNRESILDSKVYFYPNPVGNSLTINLDFSDYDQCRLNLYDLNGQLVEMWELNQNENNLDFTTIKRGFYIGSINRGDNITTVKIIKN